MTEPSEARPLYAKLRERLGSNLFMITCDEGWRSSILATGMYEPVADWLISKVQGLPLPHTPERETMDAELRKLSG